MDNYNIDKLKFKRPFKVYWLRLPNGKVQSYRFRKEEARVKVEQMLKQGAKELPDPFRKGGPGSCR